MEPRDILRRNTDLWSDEDPLTVLVDTPAINEQISYGNEAAHRFLQYHKHSLFNFIRTPEPTRYSEIEEIHPYSFIEEEEGRRSIRIDCWSDRRRDVGFLYTEEDVRDIAGRVFKDEKEEIEAEVDPTEEQVETVRKVYIQASINRDEAGKIFVTEQKILLSNRRWFENHVPGRQLNIMTLDEAIEYLGLYCRFRENYPIRPQIMLDMTLWYLSLFRTLVPRFHVEQEPDDQYLRGFATRVQSLLIAVDRLGYQYFQRPDNRTQLNMQYHFDHAISLITGSFDALALKTTVIHGIEGIEKEYISLSNNRGRGFLKNVRKENSSLRDHIAEYMPYINLIYAMRPLIVHRGGYQGTQFRSEDEDWTSRMIALEQLAEEYQDNFFRYYREIEDETQPYDPISMWGYYEPEMAEFELLEPYHFIKAAATELIQFSNEYLRLLGYTDFFEELREAERDSDLGDQCQILREDALTRFYQEFNKYSK